MYSAAIKSNNASAANITILDMHLILSAMVGGQVYF
jgi:hypothetical protein